MQHLNHEKYILHCIELARRGEYYVAPNPMVGALLVRNSDGQILAEGWHERFGGPHAEVNCLKSLPPLWGQRAALEDCSLYVSLEPCSHHGKTPPCADLIIAKGIRHVVIGMLDPNTLVAGQGIAKLRAAGIDVTVGVCEKECRALNKRFLSLHEQHRPYVTLKWAQTADGFIDARRTDIQAKEHLNGALPISTEATKQIVHRMRAENMAIMVGTNTVLMDNPRLLTTHWEGRNPIRVTIDRHNRIPTNARFFARTESDYAGQEPFIVYHDQTDWHFILSDLAQRGIHSILVEGGTTLLNHILQTGIWDEAHIEIAPELTIRDGIPAPQLPLPDTYDLIDGHQLYTITNIK